MLERKSAMLVGIWSLLTGGEVRVSEEFGGRTVASRSISMSRFHLSSCGQVPVRGVLVLRVTFCLVQYEKFHP